MKHVFLFFVCLMCFASRGFAQSQNVYMSKMGDDINVFEAEKAQFVGRNGDLTYIVVNRPQKIRLNDDYGFKVASLDNNLNVVQQLVIPYAKDDRVVASNMYHGRIHVLLKRSEKRGVSYVRYIIDQQSMQPVGDPETLHRYEFDRRDNVYNWVSQSPDNNLTAIVSVVVNTKEEKLDAVEILLDEEMNVEWRREYPIYALNDMIVTEDGEIVTIGHSKYKTEKASTVYMSVLSADNTQNFEQKMDIAVFSSQLIGFKNNKVLSVGVGVDVTDKKSVKYYGLSVDIADNTAHSSAIPLSVEEKTVLVNTDFKRKKWDIVTPEKFIVASLCKATENGGVATIQCRWIEEVCRNGICNYVHYVNGIIVFGVDDDGEITWHHPVRCDYAASFEGWVSNRICIDGDKVHYIQSEMPGWPDTYDISKVVKTCLFNSCSKVAFYTINAHGTISKTVIQLPKKAFLVGDVALFDHQIIGMGCNKANGAFIRIDL